jgi:spermidine synthase
VWRALAAAGVIVCLAGMARRTVYPVLRAGCPWLLLEKADSGYGEVKVIRYRASLVLLLDGALQTGLELSSRTPLFPYAAGMAELLQAAHPSARRVLLVGFGGGVLATTLANKGLRVDSVEIDPAVADAAFRYFVPLSLAKASSPEARLPVAIEDGRVFLGRTAPASYDAVILDAYAGEAPPAHLFTAEAYRLVARALKPDGIGLANLIGVPTGPHSGLVRSVGLTMRVCFPWVEAYAMDDAEVSNVLFVFGARRRQIRRLARMRLHPQVAAQVEGLLSRKVDLEAGGGFVLTDEYNPIESLNIFSRERMRRYIVDLVPAWLLLQ